MLRLLNFIRSSLQNDSIGAKMSNQKNNFKDKLSLPTPNFSSAPLNSETVLSYRIKYILRNKMKRARGNETTTKRLRWRAEEKLAIIEERSQED